MLLVLLVVCHVSFLQALDVIEIMATLLFTLEYGLRYFSAPEAGTSPWNLSRYGK